MWPEQDGNATANVNANANGCWELQFEIIYIHCLTVHLPYSVFTVN